MTSARAIEFRITRDLMTRRSASAQAVESPVVRRLICVAALAGGMLLFGSMVPELLGALLAAGVLAALAGDPV
jgi:hypothetical protein